MSEITWNRVVTYLAPWWDEVERAPMRGLLKNVLFFYETSDRFFSAGSDESHAKGKISCQVRGETLFMVFAPVTESHDDLFNLPHNYRADEVIAELRKDPKWGDYSMDNRYLGGAFFFFNKDRTLSVGGESEQLQRGLTPEMLQVAADHLIRCMAELGVMLKRR